MDIFFNYVIQVEPHAIGKLWNQCKWHNQGCISVGARFSENRSTVLRDPEHSSPRTRARISENQSTVLREPEHSSPRTGARFSENQSAPKLENRKTSPCSPRAPNLLHVLPSRMVGWNELCNPAYEGSGMILG